MIEKDTSLAAKAPEQGQMVRLRQRFWLVQDVTGDQFAADQPVTHHVLLECLDDDNLGEALEVIWECEIAPQLFESPELPKLAGWDSASRFDAFLTAVRWSSTSLLERDAIQSPFRAAIDIEEYQLEPVVRALTMPRANLLIADDVGLGKTIEAGLVIQEMLARRRIRRILIICPASLQQQWKDEMQDKFQLEFRIIDRDHMQQLRREYGMHVNPWDSYPRLITSMDFLKREQPMRLFQESLQQKNSPLRDWDLLIVDEAHNVAPSGRSHYAIDSDRTRMLRTIAEHFEHRLFLTATPHNGFTESFTALLELLDPLRFSRGPEVNRQQVQAVMVRRLKDEIQTSLGRRKFAERRVEALTVQLSDGERQLHDLLDQYTRSRLDRLDRLQSLPVQFALTMLKKRLLSSPLAFAHSIETHLTTLGSPRDEAPDLVLVERMEQRVNEDWANDFEKAQREDDALIESSRFFTELTVEEQGWLRSMHNLIQPAADAPDGKALKLVEWIEEHLRADGDWTGERLIVFTEYKDTLDYLEAMLAERYGGDRLLTLVGGMNLTDRETIKAAFQADPAEHPVRILVATDAASEGLNLQNHCRYLIHYEIPWNPNRMEQRNGRIDRHGQRAEFVTVYHFLYENHADSRFLQTVVDKVQTMRADLGSVGDVIAAQVEEAMLGRRRALDLPMRRYEIVKEVVRSDVLTEQRTHEIMRAMHRTQEDLSIYPETMALVLDEGLKLAGHEGLQRATDPALEGHAFRLRGLPGHWANLTALLRDHQGRALDITFDRDTSRDRRDVTLLHLSHPILRRAMDIFRARVWSEGEGDLHRVSYRILPDVRLPQPVILAFGRLVAIGALSQRLHESVVLVGGEIAGHNIYAMSADDLRHLMTVEFEYSPIPTATADDLRRLSSTHQRQLMAMLSDEEQEQRTHLVQLAELRAEEDATAIDQLMDERIRELQQRIRTEEKIPPHVAENQLELFDLKEYLQQHQEDMEWLGHKLDDLKQRRKTEPDRVRRSYDLRSVRVFPLGLLYLLPRKLVR